MKIRLKPNAIYNYCKQAGISRDELSRRIGVATTTAYRIDSGQVDPSPRFIAGFLSLTGQSFESVFEIVSEVAA